jgi:glycosyltransferase involved in cell wall biosynthesis
MKHLRVAIVHEWLVSYAGSERVVQHLLTIFPQADLYCVVDFLTDAERTCILGGRKTKTTFIQGLPGARTNFRSYLPLMPLAIEQLDLSSYDIVISSSHAVAKGVLTGPDQLHVSYVHSPIRYAWDLQHQYLDESGMTTSAKGWLARAILHYMRMWDERTAHGVDSFIANSDFIARRITKVYRRSAQVVYPPVDTESFSYRHDKEPFYLTASRMVPYKRVPLIVEAFTNMPDKRLVVIGDGPDLVRARAAAGPNVELLGYQPTAVLREYMARAKAFVFAAEEDFGITLVEAQACGTPVIAYGKGGALEIIQGLGRASEPTGVFFEAQTIDAIVDATKTFELNGACFEPYTCRLNAERFSTPRFVREMTDLIEQAWSTHRARVRRRARFPRELELGSAPSE